MLGARCAVCGSHLENLLRLNQDTGLNYQPVTLPPDNTVTELTTESV